MLSVVLEYDKGVSARRKDWKQPWKAPNALRYPAKTHTDMEKQTTGFLYIVLSYLTQMTNLHLAYELKSHYQNSLPGTTSQPGALSEAERSKKPPNVIFTDQVISIIPIV